MYFERGHKLAVYAFSIAVASALFALIIYRGLYFPAEPYIIPLRQSLNNSIVMVLVIAIVFPAIVEFNNYRWLRGVDKNIPRLLRDVTEAVRSGVPLFKALEDASARDYGPISKPLEAAMVKFKLTSDLEGSLVWLGEELNRLAAKRMSTILIEAYETGGRIIDVLDVGVDLFTSLDEYREERDAQMRPYLLIVYLGSFIFLVISWVILVQFLTPLAAASADPLVEQGGILRNVLSIDYYKAVLMWAGVMEALLGGLVAGKISEGRISVGLIHSVLLLSITVVFFNMFSV